jgi:hypothetical protein
MLRVLVLLLLLANGVYFAWSHDLLKPYGFAPPARTEPQRLAQQLRPESVRLLSSDEAKRLSAATQPGTKPLECLQAGLFEPTQAQTLRTALEVTFPTGGWVLEPSVVPARWIVYMGKYPTADALAKKRAELASLNLKFEPLTNPALEFGVSLGGYDTQAAADASLEALNKRGVRTAKVVQERAEQRGEIFKIAAVTDAIKARLEDLKPVLAGKTFRSCR